MTPYFRPNTNDADIWRDTYERNSYRLPASMKKWRVLDIGAHIGAFSRAAAERGAIVAAYEPASECVATFMLNTSGLPVTLHQQAVMAHEGRSMLVHCPIESEKSGHSLCIHPYQGRGEMVEIVSLATIIGTEPVDLVKLDCEGSEAAITNNTPDAILRLVQRWVIEFHLPHHPVPWERMAALGLRCDWRQESEFFVLAGFSKEGIHGTD